MSHHSVCPWWIGYLLASPLRRLIHSARAILAPYIREGMTIIEPGTGMGFFTLELARLAGASGHVIAVDIQPRMLTAIQRRASRASLGNRIETHLAAPDRPPLSEIEASADFLLAFAVVHEMPDTGAFFREASRCLKPGGELLLAEPSSHVKPPEFDAELRAAADAGLTVVDQPHIRASRTALLRKS